MDLQENKEIDIVKILNDNNTRAFTIRKLNEELTELSLELILYDTKQEAINGKGFSKLNLVNEIADVIIRLGCVIEDLSIQESVDFAISEKAIKLLEYKNSGLYKEF